jgi:excisionase family DNA binding protein
MQSNNASAIPAEKAQSPVSTAKYPPVSTAKYLMSKREAAQYLGISLVSLERLLRSSDLQIVRIGGLVKFRPEDLDRFIESQLGRVGR